MKTSKQPLPIADPGCAGGFAEASCQLPIKRQGGAALSTAVANRQSSFVNRHSSFAIGSGFTLIELLVVITVMATLAGFLMAVLGGISKTKYRSITSAELGHIENALEDYKAKYGVYPPSNPNVNGILLPQLYYELSGVTNNGTYYITLDNSAQIRVADVPTAFGVAGFVNCSKGSGDDATPAKDFLEGLKQNRIGSVISPIGGIAVSDLVASVGGPDVRFMSLGAANPNVNPVRYIYPGTNNPNSYDLYVQLDISGQTNLICNWSKEIIKNSPLP